MSWQGRLRQNPKKTKFLVPRDSSAIEFDDDGGLHVEERYLEVPGMNTDIEKAEPDGLYTEEDAEQDHHAAREKDKAELDEFVAALVPMDPGETTWLLQQAEQWNEADADDIPSRIFKSIEEYRKRIQQNYLMLQYGDKVNCEQNTIARVN